MIFPEEIQMKYAGCIVLYMWWLTHSIMWWMSALLTQASARMPPNFYFKTNRNSLIFFLSKITRHFASNLDVHKIYLWYCDVLLSMRAQIWLKEKKCLDGIGKLRRLQSHQLQKKNKLQLREMQHIRLNSTHFHDVSIIRCVECKHKFTNILANTIIWLICRMHSSLYRNGVQWSSQDFQQIVENA